MIVHSSGCHFHSWAVFCLFHTYTHACVWFAWKRVCLSFEKNFARARKQNYFLFHFSFFFLSFRIVLIFFGFFLSCCCCSIRHFKGILMNQKWMFRILSAWHFKWAHSNIRKHTARLFSFCRSTLWKNSFTVISMLYDNKKTHTHRGRHSREWKALNFIAIKKTQRERVSNLYQLTRKTSAKNKATTWHKWISYIAATIAVDCCHWSMFVCVSHCKNAFVRSFVIVGRAWRAPIVFNIISYLSHIQYTCVGVCMWACRRYQAIKKEFQCILIHSFVYVCSQCRRSFM